MVSISSSMGCFGIGITESRTEIAEIAKTVLMMKRCFIFFQAKISAGIFIR